MNLAAKMSVLRAGRVPVPAAHPHGVRVRGGGDQEAAPPRIQGPDYFFLRIFLFCFGGFLLIVKHTVSTIA